MIGSTGDGEAHVKDLEIAAYLDRGLRPDQVDRIEEHLVQCADCRDNVIKAQELVARTRRPRPMIQVGLLVAAAAAIVIIALPALRTRWMGDAASMRDEDSATALIAYGPVGQSTVVPIRFTWGSAPGSLSYRLSLTDMRGKAVWSTSVSDTTVVLPASVEIVGGGRYVWVVDAILSDGTTMSTGLREFGLTR
jgi:hypothetical protein